MGWYFFSQVWSYFYKIVIEIFGYQANVDKSVTVCSFCLK